MKYQINQENYHRFEIEEINKLEPRSYFIPYESKEKADATGLKEKRYGSAKVECLNGLWDFKFYDRPYEMPDILDTEEVEFDKLAVPSCWQFQGYDKPFYVNTRYQFPYNPPHIPMLAAVGKTFCWVGSDHGIKPRFQYPENEYNFVGVYRRKLQIEKTDITYLLSFLGVASCLDLYVNGQFVGYSEGSHNTAEFDITPCLTVGENELLVVVHRWCTGTYLECQDMFRNNGIFRDVLLYKMAPADIMDVDFKTRKVGVLRELAWENAAVYDAAAKVILPQDGNVTITLSGHGLKKTKIVKSAGGVAKVIFRNLKVREWNAEEPILYDLYFETEGCCIKQRVGFKSVEIRGDVFYLNGNKIKLRGVNHHDTSAVNGYTMTPDEIERDVKLCKEYNIDTIRTSHYPPDPLLLELCDELGVYVVDEADIETHGTFSQQLPPNTNSITQDEKWGSRYLDRAKRMYGRDKMHPSVIMWSLGNEAGGYHNTDLMYQWFKKVTRIPVHYENVIHTARKCYDVGSEMYPTVQKVREVGTKTRKIKRLNDRPYFMCEYAHAMGVGPGAMEEYWQEIYEYDNLMGGCVWEMADHAVLHEDGSYTYGGDHGEWEHDGNFCVDGIFYPDRTPSTGAKIVRHVYRPLRIDHVGGIRFQIFNTNSFINSDRYLIKMCYEDGRIVEFSPHVAPLSKKIVDIPGSQPLKCGNLIAEVYDKVTKRKVSEEQLLFRQTKKTVDASEITDPEKENLVSLSVEDIEIEKEGFVLEKDGLSMTAALPYTILFRAPTDNDKDFFLNSRMDDFLEQREEIMFVNREAGKVTVITKILCRKQEFICEDVYEDCEEGILLTSKLCYVKGKGKLPRFGKAYRLESSFDQVEYLGRNGESYCDMKDHTQIRKVNCKVSDMTEPNIRPQESGNRCDCQYVRVSDGNLTITIRTAEKPFELGVKPYSDVELLRMKHREDEVCSGTYVTVSAFQMGIGTGSCGPATLEQYCYPVEEEYELKFVISLQKKHTDEGEK